MDDDIEDEDEDSEEEHEDSLEEGGGIRVLFFVLLHLVSFASPL